MDVQRKKGILEVCVLAVLKKGPSYGYMIIRELEKCVEISESTLYPILKRLEQNGSLKTYQQAYNGRMRKYYQLTEDGQYKIDQFLSEWDELQNMYRFVEQQNQMIFVPQTEKVSQTEKEMETEDVIPVEKMQNSGQEAGEKRCEAVKEDVQEEIEDRDENSMTAYTLKKEDLPAAEEQKEEDVL